MENGAALKLMLAEMHATATEAGLVEGLRRLLQHCATQPTIAQTTGVLSACMADGRVRLGLANASLYLTMVGHGLIAWVWLKQALIAARALPDAAAPGDRGFYAGKLAACQYFFRYELPLAGQYARLLQSLDDTTLAMQPAQF